MAVTLHLSFPIEKELLLIALRDCCETNWKAVGAVSTSSWSDGI